MLLALDAGNSNITIGAFDGRKLVWQWRLRTVHEQTADELGIPVGTVKSRSHRAHKRLAVLLAHLREASA